MDEIGDMPLHLQAKLLRALEQKEITRLGAQTSVSVAVRVVAATNQDLEQMVEEGTFRKDLFYRLNVIPIRVPPLVERPGDIRLLSSIFLDRYLDRLEKRLVKIDEGFWDAVTAYSWPGNVRELQNAVEYAVIVMDSPGILSAELLPAAVRSGDAAARDDLNLERVEVECIRQALEACTGLGSPRRTKELAAERLGIGIATLYRKIKKYELQ